MTVVYVAGPFRARSAWAIEDNVRNAETLSLGVWKRGMVALCPHTNARFFHEELPDAQLLTGDLELLRRCDAVLLVPGWERSSGTLAEKVHADAHGIPVFTDLDVLAHWASTREE